MDKRELKKFEKILREQLEDVAGRVEQHAARSVELSRGDSDPGDVVDRSSGRADSEVDERLADSEEHLAEKIRLALQRIEEGTYGTCADCGGPIKIERLRAKPSVSLCLSCQEKKEAAARGLG